MRPTRFAHILHLGGSWTVAGISHALHRWVRKDFVDLITREHHDLLALLTMLAEDTTAREGMESTLDTVVLALTSHAEAENIALAPLAAVAGLEAIIARIRSEHMVQERALSALVCAPLGSQCSRDRAETLRDLVRHHAITEEQYLPAAIRTYAGPEAYAELAGTYVTERLRQLALLDHAGLGVEHGHATVSC